MKNVTKNDKRQQQTLNCYILCILSVLTESFVPLHISFRTKEQSGKRYKLRGKNATTKGSVEFCVTVIG